MNGRPRAALLAPVPAVVVGTLVGLRHGVAPSAFAVNAVAAVLGCAFVLVACRRPDRWRRASHAGALVALALLATSLAFEGSQGAHRWVFVGPVRINVSEVLAPYLLWTIATTMRGRAMLPVAAAALASLVHVLQPDAGQATAFGLAATVLFATSPHGIRSVRTAGSLVALGGIVLAWCRADTVTPVEHVERIVHLAFASGPLLATAALLALALLAAPFVWSARSGSRMAAAFAVYVVASIGVTELGSFPVPVLGAGASPVLGWFVLLGLLTSDRRRASPR